MRNGLATKDLFLSEILGGSFYFYFSVVIKWPLMSSSWVQSSIKVVHKV